MPEPGSLSAKDAAGAAQGAPRTRGLGLKRWGSLSEQGQPLLSWWPLPSPVSAQSWALRPCGHWGTTILVGNSPPAHSCPTTCNSLRVCIQPDIGSTRWLVRMLLYFAFKANPHTSTHTATWPKFEKPFLQYHSCYLIIYHSAQRQQISSGMRDRNSSRNADHSASQMSPWTTEPIRTCDRENNRIR